MVQHAGCCASFARWESTASRTVPGERYQLLLAHRYARSGSGELALGTGSDFDTLLTALAHHGMPAQRTRELRDLVVRSTSVDDGQLLALLADPTRLPRYGSPGSTSNPPVLTVAVSMRTAAGL